VTTAEKPASTASAPVHQRALAMGTDVDRDSACQEVLGGGLCRSRQLDDRQVSSTLDERDGQCDASGAPGLVYGWPLGSRLDDAGVACRATVDLRWGPSLQCLMGAVVVEPGRVAAQLVPHRGELQRHDNPSRALSFHGTHEPFEDRDARVPSDGPEARPYALAAAPRLEGLAEELATLVRDNGVRLGLEGLDRALQEPAQLGRGRHLLEQRQADHATRELVDGTRRPTSRTAIAGASRTGSTEPRSPPQSAQPSDPRARCGSVALPCWSGSRPTRRHSALPRPPRFGPVAAGASGPRWSFRGVVQRALAPAPSADLRACWGRASRSLRGCKVLRPRPPAVETSWSSTSEGGFRAKTRSHEPEMSRMRSR